MRWASLAIPIVLVLCACSSVQMGREFDLSTFEMKVQRGVSTQAEVRAWLGAPTSVGASVESSGDRYEEWTYYHGLGSLPSMADARLKILQVKFDAQGVVRAYNWSGEPK